ncbi:MAG TPA: DNA methyltransferase [Lichenihabitans sp.]|nr:DNA methyltransferase [Lichenihabitans sp.]
MVIGEKTQLKGDAPVDAFIGRWRGLEGGQERANYGLFLIELCDVLGLKRPDPASASSEGNDYVFERAVKRIDRDGSISYPRIDLYKRGCFILEAKQSRLKGGRNEVVGQIPLAMPGPTSRGRRGAERAWDVLMFNARQQAEDYVRLLPAGHEPPPFVVVCDVGHCFEIYANFRRDGKLYDQFPDRQRFRVYLDDLRDATTRERLRLMWTEPASLDPARHAARVTRAIAARLAAVSKALEAQKHAPEAVAMFLMRCLFTMFAEDVGLLPEASFKRVLERCEAEPAKFVPMVGQLWEAMDKGGFAYAIEAEVKRFNGEFFERRKVLALDREEIRELRQAASHDWRDVDPSIFGALLEQALDPNERRRLGAHYTPRAYVERLVVATVIEPLRADWINVFSTAERLNSEGRGNDAIKAVTGFHQTLCATRILDPACGTGNFLYVSLELMKRLEGEVLEALAALGGQETLSLEGHTVDPHQFLGLEVNPRAAAIAELVLWIGHLQWHLRVRGGMPSEPILRAFKNIVVKDAVLQVDKVPARDEDGKPITPPGPDGALVELEHYKHPRRPEWPPAEFIVGNPPFIGGKDLRARTGDDYAEALWAANIGMNESADFVMYWWNRTAELLTRKDTVLRRFGFVTTNSISQVFQRRVVQRHLSAKAPVSIVMAIPDHPWTKQSRDAAAVRIAMTVCAAGKDEGVRREVVREAGLDTDAPIIEFDDLKGIVNADLTVGADVTAALPLMANKGVCHDGVKLHGAGFIVTPPEAVHLGLGRREGLELHIRPYRNGRDLASRPRGVMVIDLFGLSANEVRERYPEVYQHIASRVKPERDSNNRESYRALWWVFGEPRRELRPSLVGLARYIATVDTARHRVFQFLPSSFVLDDKNVIVADQDAYVLGILSSKPHVLWAMRAGGWLGVGNDSVYTKTRTFDPFPFPAADDLQKQRIRAVTEDLDAHRKRVLAEHPHLTLTGLYNVLERLRSGVGAGDLKPDEHRTFDDGLVLILKELHDRLDSLVAEAYGWPVGLSDDDILDRLVALNRERAAEEAWGFVRWLRPEYQMSRFGLGKEKAELDLVGGMMRDEAAAPASPRPSYPADEAAQTAMVMAALARATGPLDATAISAAFKGRGNVAKIAAVLNSLYRMGIAVVGADGVTFTLRRVA